MYERAYPTRDGLPVPTAELDLRPSELDPSSDINRSWHHLQYDKKFYVMTGSLILKTLRDLEFNHEHMMNDQHNFGKYSLHALLAPPARPTFSRALERIEEGYEEGERLHVRDDRSKKWVYQNLTAITMKQIYMEYNRIQEKAA